VVEGEDYEGVEEGEGVEEVEVGTQWSSLGQVQGKNQILVQIIWISFVSSQFQSFTLTCADWVHPVTIGTEVAIMKKVDHPNIASVHEVIDVTSDDALLSEQTSLLFAYEC